MAINFQRIITTAAASVAFALAAAPVEANGSHGHGHRTKAVARKDSSAKSAPTEIKPARATPGGSYIVIDTKTGETLFEENSLAEREPASLIKTLALMPVFDAIRAGNLHYEDKLKLVAAEPEDIIRQAVLLQAAKRDKKGRVIVPAVPVGTPVPVEILIPAATVTSAADAVETLSVALCGTTDCIAGLMNKKLDEIFPNGHITVAKNGTGMPAKGQISNAREMAEIMRYMRNTYKDEFRFFGMDEYEINGQTKHGHMHVTQMYNRRGLIKSMSCKIEGGKTGYTNAAGSNIDVSAVCENHAIIAVRMGDNGAYARDVATVTLVDAGIAKARSIVPTPLHWPEVLTPAPELEPELDQNASLPEKKIGQGQDPSIPLSEVTAVMPVKIALPAPAARH
jgi:D-alanyl-D-alanine carboxypeptidase